MRILGDSRENERRISEEVNRQGRRQKLLYEAESSARQASRAPTLNPKPQTPNPKP